MPVETSFHAVFVVEKLNGTNKMADAPGCFLNKDR
jgi:hypothetical protein